LTKELLDKLFSMDGKVVFITGGYRGIGLTFAETYAAVGASVILAARNLRGCEAAADNIARTYGVKATGIALDVREAKSVDHAVIGAIDGFGTIDVLVNCAAISGCEKPAIEMTDSDLDEIMNVDFRGTFLVSRSVAQHMAHRKSGRIINVASILGKVATRNLLGYCASKAAVIQLTRVMALELMRDNVQVNVLCPGYFMTDLNKEFFSSAAGQSMVQKRIPMRRVGRLEELQSAALYLATCPPYLTGTELYIDGGHTIV
jgi:NAD(P)-dependent dehydrogenase (short-subunit alcohol dehydrogenase family)